MWTSWTPLSPLSNGGLIRLWTSADLDAARPALGVSTEGLVSASPQGRGQHCGLPLVARDRPSRDCTTFLTVVMASSLTLNINGLRDANREDGFASVAQPFVLGLHLPAGNPCYFSRQVYLLVFILWLFVCFFSWICALLWLCYPLPAQVYAIKLLGRFKRLVCFGRISRLWM